MIWRFCMVYVAFLLLGAHFLRSGFVILVVACCLAPFLLLFRRRPTRVAVQLLLYAGTLVWLWTAYALTRERMEANKPWIRMVVVLVGVAAYTAAAGLVLRSDQIKSRSH